MSSQWNDYAYEKEFVGSLNAESEPVPIEVNTRLRVMTSETAREVRKYKHRHSEAPPKYEFSGGANLSLHPSLLAASGRHFFEW